MIQKTYSIDEDEKTLSVEAEYDNRNNLIAKTIHHSRPKSESKFTYDDQDRLTCETDLNNGKEICRTEFKYDDEGDIIEQLTYFSNSLFESIILTKTSTGYIRKTCQDGELIERYERDVYGENWKSRFYNKNVLVDEHEYVYDTKKRIGVKTINDIEFGFKLKIVELFDKQNNMIKYQEFKDEANLLSELIYTYANSELTRIEVKDFENDLGEYVYDYELDRNGNTIKFTCKSSTGALNCFHNRVYNDNNQLIEEFGVNNGSFNGIDGTSVNSEKFHLIHEYE